MEVFRWPSAKVPSIERPVAAIGVFDGVHLGHKRLIEEAAAVASDRAVPLVVATFDPDPAEVLQATHQPAITSMEHRLRLFERLQVHYCMIIEFSRGLAELEPEDFVRNVLQQALAIQVLVVGYNWRFGRDRRGGVELCSKLGLQMGFETAVVPPVKLEGETVSSTAIRNAISCGSFGRAEKLLGRPYSVLGRVVRGDGRGRTIGFPTVNLERHHELLPPAGVYAVRTLLERKSMPGVCSIGTRETFHPEDGAPIVLEVHLFDTELDLYGREFEVQFVGKIRGQRRFRSARALRDQVSRDAAAARRMLAGGKPAANA